MYNLLVFLYFRQVLQTVYCMINKEELFPVGKVCKAHSLQGEVVCEFTDFSFDENDADFLVIDLGSFLVPFFLEEYRFKNDIAAIVKFEGVESEADANKLVGKSIYLPLTFKSGLTHENITWKDFVGFHVYDKHVGELGEIAYVDESTANILFVVLYRGEEVYIPAVEEFVLDIQLDKKNIYMDLPEGLLAMDEAVSDED